MSLADEFAPPSVPRSVNTYLVGDCAAAGAASAAPSDMTANRRLVAIEDSLRISGLLRACGGTIGRHVRGFRKGPCESGTRTAGTRARRGNRAHDARCEAALRG